MNTDPVEVRDLTKTFGSFTALDAVDLTVTPGSVHGFLGPNGAGKSTTIRILLGLYRATSGHVRVLGLDPGTHPAQVTRQVSYVPGDVALWPNLTGAQVLDLLAGLRGIRDETRERQLIERFAFDPYKKVRSYSTGNRQKVLLIAALAAPTPLLVLDEPTSGLDPLMEQVFHECVREATATGRSVLLSSHILAEVERLCTEVTIVSDGRVVESGSLQRLRHLAAMTVTVQASDELLAALAADLRDHAPKHADGRLVSEVERDRLPEVLARIAASGATEVTVAPASLESLFLRHYAVAAR
ncbi:ABC transporter ATP-binding protein [Ornithinimicrobium pratense]|uniref:ABC transporter ATP-binding protein n=1 Tax=Ornithinimicrobium pratense TaxID=2593973 RepID=A0A5J6V4Q7_9MICO|nr:ABC transporter ATP-binding protein [Ornithinimicrobium pratense]QFG68111.1 ABC transporter ATP-binding protein [Ornithinimicrobium pratense]